MTKKPQMLEEVDTDDVIAGEEGNKELVCNTAGAEHCRRKKWL
jgi:hypothetical protein